MHINFHLHEHPLLRRVSASLTGALIALTCHAVYQDVSAMVLSHARAAEVHESAPADEDAAAKVRAFAEQLKAQRGQNQE